MPLLSYSTISLSLSLSSSNLSVRYFFPLPLRLTWLLTPQHRTLFHAPSTSYHRAEHAVLDCIYWLCVSVAGGWVMDVCGILLYDVGVGSQALLGWRCVHSRISCCFLSTSGLCCCFRWATGDGVCISVLYCIVVGSGTVGVALNSLYDIALLHSPRRLTRVYLYRTIARSHTPPGRHCIHSTIRTQYPQYRNVLLTISGLRCDSHPGLRKQVSNHMMISFSFTSVMSTYCRCLRCGADLFTRL
jgi:hypothetical protein